MNKSLLSLLSLSTFVFFILSPLKTLAYYTNMPASVVVGQQDFVTIGGSTTQAKLGGSTSVFVDDQSRLIVADLANNRVLIWNNMPSTNGASANLVLGQADFVSGSANRGGSVGANTLSQPSGILVHDNKLYVADTVNRRILVWNTFPTVNGVSADIVIGQASMSASSTSCDSATLNRPWDLRIYNGKLIVSDSNQFRVLIWNQVPTTNGVPADVVLGQPDMNTCSTPSSAAANNIRIPRGLEITNDGKLLVVDNSWNRILVWNNIPTSNNQSADGVIGQGDFFSSSTAVSATRMSGPLDVAVVNSRLFVTDQNNSRVLIFNSLPTSNGASADMVLGQTDMDSNSTPVVSASALDAPAHLFVHNNKLLVSSRNSYARILIFNNILSSPHLSVSKVEQLSGDSGKLKITGSTEIGERGRYSLSSVVASVNGLGYGNVTSKDNGRDNGDGKTLYEFTHEFEPWVNNNGDKNTWKDKGYTVALKAISSNAEEDEVLLFSPFVLKAMSKDTSSLEFVVPTAHWSTLTDKLSGYRIEVKRKTDKEWGTLTTISPSHSNNTTVSGSTTNPTYTSTLPSSSLTPLSKSLKINTVTSSYTPSTEEIKVKVDTTLPSGEYRIQAVSKTGSSFSSNTISHTSSTISYLPSLTLTTSWFPLQINKISGTTLPILSSFSSYTPKPLTTSTTTPTVSGIAPSYSTVYLQVTNSTTPTQKKLYKTTTTSNTSFTIPISLYPNSTLDTWVTNTHNTTVLSPISLTTNSNLSVLGEYVGRPDTKKSLY